MFKREETKHPAEQTTHFVNVTFKRDRIRERRRHKLQILSNVEIIFGRGKANN